MEDSSKPTETVRPQSGEHCESQSECDSALRVNIDGDHIELNGETDDEDMEDGRRDFRATDCKRTHRAHRAHDHTTTLQIMVQVLCDGTWCDFTIGCKNNYRPAFFISTSNSGKHNQDPAKDPEFREMAIMIFLSELILAFSGVKQRIGEYERGEERKEKREQRRRCGLRCNVLSRAVLSCAVDNCIKNALRRL